MISWPVANPDPMVNAITAPARIRTLFQFTAPFSLPIESPPIHQKLKNGYSTDLYCTRILLLFFSYLSLEIVFFKYGLLGYFSLKCFERPAYHSLTDLLGIHFALGWITKRIRNTNTWDNSVGADCQGNRNYRCHMYYRNPIFFDSFNHRCTATSTGTSCSDEDNPVNMLLFCEDLTDLITKFCCRSCRSSCTCCCTEEVFEFTELSVSFHFTKYIKRNYQVRICHNELTVISTMDCCKLFRAHRIFSFDGVDSELRC